MGTNLFGGIPVESSNNMFGGIPVAQAPAWQPKKRGLADLQAMAQPVDNTEGTNPIALGYAGAGKSLYDSAQGVGQIFGITDQADVDSRHAIDQQLMHTPSGFIGNVAGQVGQMAVPGMGVARGAAIAGRAAPMLAKVAPYAASALENAAFSGVQATNTGESKIDNMITGAEWGAGGRAVADVVGRGARGIVSQLDEPTKKLAAKAREYGIPLGWKELTRNPMVRNMMDQASHFPLGGGVARAEEISRKWGRAVGRTFGVKGDMTHESFAAAKAKISEQFERLTSRNHLKVTPRLKNDVTRVTSEYLAKFPTTAGPLVASFVDDFNKLLKNNGKMLNGTAYQEFDRKIAQFIKNGQGETKIALGDLRDVLREGMDASIKPSDAAAWKMARRMWANMKTVEPLVGKSAVGEMSPANLMGRINRDAPAKVRAAVAKGGELQTLAQIGKHFYVKPPNTASGDRAFMNWIGKAAVKYGPTAAGVGTVAGAQHQNIISPEQAAWAGALMLGNRYGLKAINSKTMSYGSPMIQAAAKSQLPNTLASTMRAYKSGQLTEEEKRDMGRVGW